MHMCNCMFLFSCCPMPFNSILWIKSPKSKKIRYVFTCITCLANSQIRRTDPLSGTSLMNIEGNQNKSTHEATTLAPLKGRSLWRSLFASWRLDRRLHSAGCQCRIIDSHKSASAQRQAWCCCFFLSDACRTFSCQEVHFDLSLAHKWCCGCLASRSAVPPHRRLQMLEVGRRLLSLLLHWFCIHAGETFWQENVWDDGEGWPALTLRMSQGHIENL